MTEDQDDAAAAALEALRREATAARVRELGGLLPLILDAFETGVTAQDIEATTDVFGVTVELVEVVQRLWEGRE